MMQNRIETIKKQFKDLTEGRIFNMSAGCLLSSQKYRITNSSILFRIELEDSKISLFQVRYEHVFEILSVFDHKDGYLNLAIKFNNEGQKFTMYLKEIEDGNKNI